jgi:hypothetical protein
MKAINVKNIKINSEAVIINEANIAVPAASIICKWWPTIKIGLTALKALIIKWKIVKWFITVIIRLGDDKFAELGCPANVSPAGFVVADIADLFPSQEETGIDAEKYDALISKVLEKATAKLYPASVCGEAKLH